MVKKTSYNRNSYIFLLLFMVAALITMMSYSTEENDYVPKERNYYAEAMLGISPNMPSHLPSGYDLDTKLNLQTSEGQVYRMFENRNPQYFFDYGKTFVVRVK